MMRKGTNAATLKPSMTVVEPSADDRYVVGNQCRYSKKQYTESFASGIVVAQVRIDRDIQLVMWDQVRINVHHKRLIVF